MKKEYKYVTVQLCGNLENYEYSYYPSYDSFSSVKKAEKAGIKELGHDDFVIGEFENDKCVAVHITTINVGRYTKESEDFGEYVIGINKEIGEYDDEDEDDEEYINANI